jgi:hypothetical protein
MVLSKGKWYIPLIASLPYGYVLFFFVLSYVLFGIIPLYSRL